MHSKQRYKICICSVILGEIESFRNITGATIQRITKVRIFLIPVFCAFLDPKILGFLYCKKNSLTWKVKCEKLNFIIK